ncbi:recombinase family protein [Solibacillus sp. FSL H8-0523]|uniref:recombinase family protein n=1 Tax=Solibacillus sp. FSL H8-0523 TaxID=2954511 RepID=UPI00310193A0
MTKYGYCRVANNSEGSLEIQKAMMQNEMCDEILAEVRSGIKEPSDAFEDLMSRLKKGDTLVLFSLDRLSRDPIYLQFHVMKLFEKGVTIHSLDIGILDDEYTKSIFINTLDIALGMERNHRVERLKEGKRIAKQREGYVEGRPKTYTPEQLEHAMKLLETKTYNEVAAETKISRSTLIREKSKRKNLSQ